MADNLISRKQSSSFEGDEMVLPDSNGDPAPPASTAQAVTASPTGDWDIVALDAAIEQGTKDLTQAQEKVQGLRQSIEELRQRSTRLHGMPHKLQTAQEMMNRGVAGKEETKWLQDLARELESYMPDIKLRLDVRSAAEQTSHEKTGGAGDAGDSSVGGDQKNPADTRELGEEVGSDLQQRLREQEARTLR